MVTVHRISESKIAEDRLLVESLGFFQQLGVLPSTEELIRNYAQRGEPGARC